MTTTRSALLIACLSFTLAYGLEARAKSPDPEAVVARFDQRVEQIFRAESGKPLVRAKKQKPLGPGRGNYVRAYSYSMVEFAARCLFLNEMLDEANAALAENAQHYLDNPKDINDRDSFHWHADIVMRLIEMYGTNGTNQAGRISRETEALCLKPIWLYAKKSSWLGKAEYEESKTWHIYSSENHHAMDFTVCWHFAKIAKDRPEYRNLKFDDGATATEHYRAWNEYFIVYCRERARKGPCIEMMCPGYNSVWLKGFFNFHDFGDERVRRSAAMLFDLYWAYWAQEQINGVDGGGKSRIRGVNGFTRARHGIPDLGWLYFGIGEPPSILAGNLNAALSGYRPPAVIADIAWNARGNGPFEVRQRAQGLGKQGIANPTATESNVPSKLRTDGGGIIRYSYCDPAFTIGTLMFEARPLEDWVHISAQGRWQGVVFAGRPDSRIVPIVQPGKGRDVLNGQWSVQSKGCLITQKLKDHKGGGEMIVWMSKEGLEPPVTKGNVVFIEAEKAYAAVRVVAGGFQLVEDSLAAKAADGGTRTAPPGRVLIPEREFSPVILEVMAKDQVESFEEFQGKVLACEWKMDGPVLIYDSIYGERLTFDSSYQNVPTINGQPINYAPKKLLESPFLNADYNGGIVTISKGERKKVLDFTVPSESGLTDVSTRKAVAVSKEQEAFEKASIGDWQETFSDDCTADWTQKWFLDGEVGTVKTGPHGMTLTAGPEFKNDAHHMVLWTKASFAGDLKIEYDYTRLDEEERCVTILYIQATGSGEEPYAKDISKWNDLRNVPSMKTYYNHMNTYHISYAAFPNTGEERTSYIRGRRYMPEATGLKGTDLEPDYYPQDLFTTGVKHHITVIKKERDLFMRIENREQVYYCRMTNPNLPIITEGRIGLRHMFTRSANYGNLRVSSLTNREKPTPAK